MLYAFYYSLITFPPGSTAVAANRNTNLCFKTGTKQPHRYRGRAHRSPALPGANRAQHGEPPLSPGPAGSLHPRACRPRAPLHTAGARPGRAQGASPSAAVPGLGAPHPRNPAGLSALGSRAVLAGTCEPRWIFHCFSWSAASSRPSAILQSPATPEAAGGERRGAARLCWLPARRQRRGRPGRGPVTLSPRGNPAVPPAPSGSGRHRR